MSKTIKNDMPKHNCHRISMQITEEITDANVGETEV